jgi:hypothetical protein
VSHDSLQMDSVLPTATVLYNYDTDRDGSPGLVIAKGGSGSDESDPAKRQVWRTPVFPTAVTIGHTYVKLWSAMKDPSTDKLGVVTVYLRDCEGSNCVQVGSSTLSTQWHSGSTWNLITFIVPIETWTMSPGHALELVVVVDASSDDDMWFAYDTNNYKSRVSP